MGAKNITLTAESEAETAEMSPGQEVTATTFNMPSQSSFWEENEICSQLLLRGSGRTLK